jgi:hypothetical protein
VASLRKSVHASLRDATVKARNERIANGMSTKDGWTARPPTSPKQVPDPAEGVGSHGRIDVYFSADVETDGPIPGPYSMLSFALVYAGTYDGVRFDRPKSYEKLLYKELRPISSEYQREALAVNGLDRDLLIRRGQSPEQAMTDAAAWTKSIAGSRSPVLVAYPLSFDWTWLYWYFIRFCPDGSPFDYSRCHDVKTAMAVKAGIPISAAGRSRLPPPLASSRNHTHHAVDDAIEQAEIFANIFEWEGRHGRP